MILVIAVTRTLTDALVFAVGVIVLLIIELVRQSGTQLPVMQSGF